MHVFSAWTANLPYRIMHKNFGVRELQENRVTVFTLLNLAINFCTGLWTLQNLAKNFAHVAQIASLKVLYCTPYLKTIYSENQLGNRSG